MQRYRVVILIVVFGMLPAAVAFFVALSYLKGEAGSAQVAVALPAASDEGAAGEPAEPSETRRVLAAARPLPVGSLIGEEDLTALEIEADTVRKGHFLAGEEEPEDVLRGYAVRVPIAPGEAVLRSAVVGPGQRGFLAAVLGSGARAVTIRVGPATSHAGLIDPGDRVDVILSAELETTGGNRSVLARTIVEDVRVVAVDRRVGSPGGSTGGAESGTGDVEGTQRTEMITATLEVSPEQGDRLVLGEHEGKLSLAVRSLSALVPRTSSAAVELQDLLLSPDAVAEAEAAMVADGLREEIASLEERLHSEEEARLRREEEERLRREREERAKAAERERQRLEEKARLRDEVAALEARLRAEESERKRLEEEERARIEAEERRRAAEEERLRREEAERLRTAEAERRRLAEEIARLKAEAGTAPPPDGTDTAPIRTVRVFRGSKAAEETLFRGSEPAEEALSGAGR